MLSFIVCFGWLSWGEEDLDAPPHQITSRTNVRIDGESHKHDSQSDSHSKESFTSQDENPWYADFVEIFSVKSRENSSEEDKK
jgi:hypothetical protein